MPVIKIVKGKQTVVCGLLSIYLLLANSVIDGLGTSKIAPEQPEKHGHTKKY